MQKLVGIRPALVVHSTANLRCMLELLDSALAQVPAQADAYLVPGGDYCFSIGYLGTVDFYGSPNYALGIGGKGSGVGGSEVKVSSVAGSGLEEFSGAGGGEVAGLLMVQLTMSTQWEEMKSIQWC